MSDSNQCDPLLSRDGVIPSVSADCRDGGVHRRHARDRVGLSLWLIGPLASGLYSLSLGRHAGFDYLNVRWFLSWLLLRDVEGMPGAVERLAYQPYVNEGVVGLLSLTGAWWFPVAALGLVHGLIIPLSYDTCRAVTPSTNRLLVTATALLTLASPLTSVHIGREDGHLLAAVALLVVVRHVVRRGDHSNGLLVAVLIVLVFFIKFSAVLTVAVAFVAVVFSLPARRALQTLTSFVGVVWVAIGVSSVNIWRSQGVSRQFALGEIVLEPRVFVAVGLLMFTVSLVLCGLVRLGVHRFLKLPSFWFRYRGLALGTTLILISVGVRAVSIAGDPRFNPDSLLVVFRRLLSTGDLAEGVTLGSYSVRDLEYAYFDLGKGLAILVAASALLILLFRVRGDSSAFGPLHVAVIPGVAVWANMASYGYVRYATEALVLLPVGVFALLSAIDVRRILRSLAALLAALVLLLPALGLGGWQGYGHRVGRPGHGPLVSDQERDVLSGLIPQDSAVFFFGNLTSWIAPVVDRVDPTWFVKPLRPRDAEASTAVLFYDLANVADLDKFTTREWSMTDCQALRFENVAVGWCRLDANQVDE